MCFEIIFYVYSPKHGGKYSIYVILLLVMGISNGAEISPIYNLLNLQGICGMYRMVVIVVLFCLPFPLVCCVLLSLYICFFSILSHSFPIQFNGVKITLLHNQVYFTNNFQEGWKLRNSIRDIVLLVVLKNIEDDFTEKYKL